MAHIHLDALCHPVKLGQRYGFSRNDNGFSVIVTGTCSKLHPDSNKVTLSELHVARYIYATKADSERQEEPYDPKAKSLATCVTIFPIL